MRSRAWSCRRWVWVRVRRARRAACWVRRVWARCVVVERWGGRGEGVREGWVVVRAWRRGGLESASCNAGDLLMDYVSEVVLIGRFSMGERQMFGNIRFI